MNYKFYTTHYFQNDNTEIEYNLLSEKNFYYRFYKEPLHGIVVGERNIDGKFDAVYYVGNNLSTIMNYHRLNFREFNIFHTIESLSELTVIIRSYKNNVFNGALIVNCNNKYEEEKASLYNEKFELIEYREFFMGEKNTVCKQKIFMPSIWNIFEEEI